MRTFICSMTSGLLLLVCFGCGGGSSVSTPTPFPQLSGNYSFTLGTLGPIGGLLNTTAGNVTGNIVLSDATVCSAGVFNVFGSIKPSGVVSLFASAAGASLILDATVSSDAKTISGGSFTLSGISGCVANGQAIGFQVQDLNGVYSGILTLTHGGVGTSITWSGPLSQKLLNTGFLGLAGGDATVGGIPGACGFTTSTFSVVGGGFVFGTHSTGGFQGGANGFNFKADATDATARTLNVSMFIQGGPCSGDTVVGAITRP